MKALTALLLSATVFTAAPAFAADETAGWQDNKPQSLESLKAPRARGQPVGNLVRPLP